MNKKFSIIFVTSVLMLFSSNVYSAQKDCSAFTHKIDIKICEAKNKQSTSTTDKVSKNNGTGFFKKLSKKLNLNDNKKFRQVGDAK